MTMQQNRGVPASAGYTQFINGLQTTRFSDRIIRQTYCRSVATLMTTGDYTEGLMGCGATLGFQVEPAIDIHEYQKNQTLVPQELETEWRFLNVDRAKYFNVKIDRVDKKQVCNFNKMQSRFCENASKRMHTQLDPEVLLKIAAHADPRNKGRTAGLDQNIDLGQYGNPLNVTKSNIIDLLVDAKIVMENQCRWDEGKMVIVFPTIAERAFFASDLTNCNVTCDRSPLLNGNLRDTYMGWQVAFSNHVPRVWDAQRNKWCYYIVFGHEMATGMVQQIDECDVMKIERSFGEYYRGLWVFGHDTLIPEAVGAAYAYFS